MGRPSIRPIGWSKKGTPEVSDSILTLRIATGSGGGEAVRSADCYLYRPLTVIAKSTEWANDTSLGFESWYGSTHYAIVVTGGCLGIINQSKPRGTVPPAPPQNEVYVPISHWAELNKAEDGHVRVHVETRRNRAYGSTGGVGVLRRIYGRISSGRAAWGAVQCQ